MMGEIFALIAAVMWGFVPILDKIGVANMSIYSANFFRAIGSLTAMVIVISIVGGLKGEIEPKNVAILLLSGSIAGGWAMIVYFIALQKIGVARTIPLTSIYPLFSIIFSALILKESFDYQKVFLGTVLIVAGLIILQR